MTADTIAPVRNPAVRRRILDAIAKHLEVEDKLDLRCLHDERRDSFRTRVEALGWHTR
jgi:hypothetical protein